MPQNVFVVGPQCTGKTTLVLALEEYLTSIFMDREPPTVIHEVVRDVMKSTGISTRHFNTHEWNRLQSLTLQAQNEAESALDGKWFISDRSGIDPLIYAQVSKQNGRDLRLTAEWRACRQRMREGVVVLCEAGDQAWLSSDDARLEYRNVTEWEALNQQFKTLLEEEDIPFATISKHVLRMEDRLHLVVEQLRT